MVTNWSKILGGVSVALGLFVLAIPIPDNYKVYIIGAETILNGMLQYWYGTPSGNQPLPATTKA